MGSRNDTGGRLRADDRSGAGQEAPAEALSGSSSEHDDRDNSHVTLTGDELRRLIYQRAPGG
jgi:hypothetical protein